MNNIGTNVTVYFDKEISIHVMILIASDDLDKIGYESIIEDMNTSGDMSMIGQFGGGLQLTYVAAGKACVISKINDDEQYVWESECFRGA